MEGAKTLASLGEFGLIRELFTPLGRKDELVDQGIGDDAAVFSIPRTQQLLTTTDTLLEGIHFNSDMDPFLLARKALRVNLADIAAMGGLPKWYLLSIAVPPNKPLEWLEEFGRGLKEAGEQYDVFPIGGDTVGSKGPVVITITLFGIVGEDRAMKRSGAQVGDKIFVSGTIGDSALGLSQRLGSLQVRSREDLVYLKHRHQLPEPRLALGALLQESSLPHACIDVSDGLVADLGHICAASGVGAEIDVAKIPFSEAAKRQVADHGEALLGIMLTGGEDYELLFTVAPGMAEQLVADAAEKTGVMVTEIGQVVKSDDHKPVVLKDGEAMSLSGQGWTHF
ncbi:MAG: thiamine-phosphate kinase [Magnetococcales bacterium]|nr:thiamine-phosphate kinase [Magnetococcales bacterium]